MQGMSVALNDKLGFLLEDMPEGLDWYEHGMMNSGDIQMTSPNDHKKQSKHAQQKRNKSGKVREVKTVRTNQKRRTKSRADGMESLTGNSSRKPSHRRTQSSVAASDPKSDAANNTSPGKVEEWDFMSVQIGIEGAHSGQCGVCEEERCPQPMSTLPLKEMDVAANNQGRNTLITPTQSADCRHSDTSNHKGRDPLLESEFSIDEEQASVASVVYRSTSDQEKNLESEEKGSLETPEGIKKEVSVDELESGFEAVEKDRGVLNEDWRSSVCTAEDLFNVSEDETARKNASQDSVDEFTDAMSRSCQSSRELDAERKPELAETVPSKKSFLRRKKLDRPSNSEETSKKRKSKRPKFLTAIGARLSKARRNHCCRFSFKACFCGADVSPGPEQDGDLADPQTQEQ